VKTVLAHEWFVTPAGSDKVAARIASALDVEKVVTAIDYPQVSQGLLGARPVQPLWTNRLPGVGAHRMKYAPALLSAWATAQVGPADLLVSSTHFGAMGAGRRFDGPHIAYCYSPLRYAWRHDLESGRLSGVAGKVAGLTVPTLRKIDRESASSASLLIAISSSIAERIRTSYGRSAPVIFPCVDVEAFATVAQQRVETRGHSGYFLCFGRMVAYKRIDLAVRMCTERALPLVVAGAGPHVAALREMAGPTVTFVEQVSDDRYRELLAGATALLFPGEEDFGITIVEAMAAGVPVIAYGAGGALDTVVDGVTGLLCPEQTTQSLGAAIDRFTPSAFSAEKLVAHSHTFSAEVFDTRLNEVVAAHVKSGQRDAW
jgi:glycosyltransferase involved in cell wall biosynthesis